MTTFVDRRPNGSGKNLGNRQRFLRRVRDAVKRAVREATAKGTMDSVYDGGTVTVPSDGLREPFIHRSGEGFDNQVHPGNRHLEPGDLIPRPEQGGSGSGSGAPGRGESEDDFTFALSAEEFLEYFLADLELPDLERKSLMSNDSESPVRAGYSVSGPPANLAIIRTMRNAQARRIALRHPDPEELERLEHEYYNTDGGTSEESAALLARIEELRTRLKAIPYIDPVDVRYRRFDLHPKPITRAVMFCVMDVSASMDERKKDLAKRYFMLLNVFLRARYEHVDVVYVRHTDEADECDEHTFFYGRWSGGTRVSSAVELTLQIARERYLLSDWNLYVAQASDGENSGSDNEHVEEVLEALLPMVQYYTFLETPNEGGSAWILPPGSISNSLWAVYERLIAGGHKNLAQRRVMERTEIFPIFRDLFRKRTGGDRLAAVHR